MSDPRSATDRDPGLEALGLTALVASASELAREGRYADAESLLRDRLAAGRTEPEVLDLLARIKAQQGELREAEDRWRQASSLDPDNESYRSGLRRLARIQRRRTRWPWVLLARTVIAAVVVGVGILALWLAAERLGTLEDRVTELAAAGEAERRALVQQVAESNRARERTAEPAAAPDLRLDLPGVTVRHDGPVVVATFEEGLFSEGDRLGSRARELLTSVGRRLELQAGEIAVHVIGYSDDLTPWAESDFRDNAALGLSRALAVVEHLRASTTLPAEVFHVRTGGARSPPYPNNSPANRARNRTVVLRITKAPARDAR